jgi:L-lactate dehydrogenase complex protein LldE
MDRAQVQLFVTCLVDAVAPEVGRAALDALERSGCEVDFPSGQGCCGQPAFNVGMWDEARTMAEQTLDTLDDTEGPVVIPSGSCTSMIANHYSALFSGTDREEQAARVSARARELTQFLVDDLETPLRAGCGDCTVALHHSCHGLRQLGLGRQADVLLEGVDRVPLEGDDECCGFGGLFAVEMPAVSTAIMEAKLAQIEASGAEIVVGNDHSCLLHIQGGLHRRGSRVETRHIAELLSGA